MWRKIRFAVKIRSSASKVSSNISQQFIENIAKRYYYSYEIMIELTVRKLRYLKGISPHNAKYGVMNNLNKVFKIIEFSLNEFNDFPWFLEFLNVIFQFKESFLYGSNA